MEAERFYCMKAGAKVCLMLLYVIILVVYYAVFPCSVSGHFDARSLSLIMLCHANTNEIIQNKTKVHDWRITVGN